MFSGTPITNPLLNKPEYKVTTYQYNPYYIYRTVTSFTKTALFYQV